MPNSPEPTNRMANSTEGTDTVELKVTVSEQKERAANEAFKLDPMEGQQRRIFFFDTEELSLFEKGLLLRAREVKGAADDSTVKIRPIDPESIGAKWRRLDRFKLEADGVGDRRIRSASLSVEQGDDEIRAVARGQRAIKKLFSEEQEAFLAEMSPVPVDFGALTVLGPVNALRWKVKQKGLPYDITVEEWTLPSGRDLLEVSIKVPTAQESAASADFDSFLKRLSLEPQGGQETKTRIALEELSRSRRASDAPGKNRLG
jgi:hypothetical protein